MVHLIRLVRQRLRADRPAAAERLNLPRGVVVRPGAQPHQGVVERGDRSLVCLVEGGSQVVVRPGEVAVSTCSGTPQVAALREQAASLISATWPG